MERHLEAFLVANWNQTILSQNFSIYEEEGEPIGQQYATDAGTIDILAISKDKKRLLVVELKRGRASDVVVGQVLRYMGYVKEEIAEDDQTPSRARSSHSKMIRRCAGHWSQYRQSRFIATRSTSSSLKGERQYTSENRCGLHVLSSRPVRRSA